MKLINWLKKLFTKMTHQAPKTQETAMLLVVNEMPQQELATFAQFIKVSALQYSKLHPQTKLVVSLLYVINNQLDMYKNTNPLNRFMDNDTKLNHAINQLHNAEAMLALGYKPKSYLRQGELQQEIIECAQNLKAAYLLMPKLILYGIGDNKPPCNVITIDEVNKLKKTTKNTPKSSHTRPSKSPK